VGCQTIEKMAKDGKKEPIVLWKTFPLEYLMLGDDRQPGLEPPELVEGEWAMRQASTAKRGIMIPIRAYKPGAFPISRRSFLRASFASVVASAVLPRLARAATPAGAAPKVDGALVTLPNKGTLYIANDFHTRHADFVRWLQKTDLVARLKSTDDTYGLVLGDICDKKPLDTEAEDGGDVRMLDKVREIQAGPGGDRLIFILGNHEYEAIRIHDAMKKQLGLTPENQARLVRALYNSADGDFFRQWNCMERITDEHVAYIKTLPLAVFCPNGLLALHAGPAISAKTPRDIAQRDAKSEADLVWRRPIPDYDHAQPEEHAYDSKDVDAFLKLMNSRVMVVGHTPLLSLPEAWRQDGLARVGEHAVVMAASYGCLPQQKNYLKIDLSTPYASNTDLKVNREIIPNM
jgi:hypothetical protein